MRPATIGIIGGTGLGELLLKQAGGEALTIDTPFGAPSGPIVRGSWAGAEVAFLPRHGPRHTLNPSVVPYRANIWALKQLGVTTVIASGAAGSLRQEMHPGELVVCDQVIDRTFRRESTFFEAGPVVHVAFADPFCPRLRQALLRAAQQVQTPVHDRGTYICIEGPQFSTRAEAHLHRQWAGDLVGMTCLPEAKLAREAEMCYALIALATDYDCWRPAPPGGHDELVKEVLANLQRGSEAAAELIRVTLALLPAEAGGCGCGTALDLAVWSDLSATEAATRTRLAPLLARFEAARAGK
ncbi:MAG TPA: S-methyl-5'-thioadenosine phosphorylase [Phycisphaerae bacterium]|nr:S-methyl-5'-thioadenosine phosphorylase [Phycisphaerae bacterium]HNU44845.1 S-methyl-5'-thioadenosine phosphorylase [Phycisphaerae bacterium]